MSNLEKVKAALREHVDTVLDNMAADMIHLGSKEEWSMDDNFNVTEGIARLASTIGLPSAGDQSVDQIAFWREAARELGDDYHDDFEIDITVKIDNVYDDGTVTNTVDLRVPLPPWDDSSPEFQQWADDHILEHTGTGRTEGEAGYFAKIVKTELSALTNVEFEWGV